ncbi:MAG TPA: FAD-dependent thymidylate synthase [Candidatus Dormibacteraeota bacterium]|jgi:thymidylate synthase ThyX|nr:FAD-dependent thymidylate synthase [Candidatus Dormibacteraeota bacterium]
MQTYVEPPLTAAEREILARHFTSLDGPVAALTGLPEATKAALFARYSRTQKPLKRVFLDEFAGGGGQPGAGEPGSDGTAGLERAADLFSRVLSEYGDDSVAQLACVHVSCEQVSNLLTKVLERGRLMGYLEQSTRYVFYGDAPEGRHRWYRDPELLAGPHGEAYVLAMEGLFTAYARVFEAVHAIFLAGVPPDDAARRRAARAAALDVARGLLPAGTISNVGIAASPQAYEALVLRMRAHPLPEARAYAELLLAELRKVIPDFLTRLDRPERGGVWVEYLQTRGAGLAEAARELDREARNKAVVAGPALAGEIALAGPRQAAVRLLRWTQDAEREVAANALYAASRRPLDEIRAQVRQLPIEEVARLFRLSAGDRRNRRHRPGREWEAAEYEFEVVSDYGAFRDLQRHRMLTIEWQRLSPDLGYEIPAEAREARVADVWREAVERAETAYAQIAPTAPAQASYLVTMAHRVRYLMRMNAREAMHVIELRSSPQGHASYRRVAQEMYQLIRDVAGHRLIAEAIEFVNREDVHLGRLDAERRAEAGGKP